MNVWVIGRGYPTKFNSAKGSFEFEQAKIKGKPIIIVYNSTRYESSWLPSYMKDYEDNAVPFWIKDIYGNKVGNYSYIKEALGF